MCFISLLLEALSFSLLFSSKIQNFLIWKYLCVYKRIGDFCALFFETFFFYITAFSHIFFRGAEWLCFALQLSVHKSTGTLHGTAHHKFVLLRDLGGKSTNFISADAVIQLHLKLLLAWPHKERHLRLLGCSRSCDNPWLRFKLQSRFHQFALRSG